MENEWGIPKAPQLNHRKKCAQGPINTPTVCPCSSRCLRQMEEDGLSVDDLFSQCVFRQDERDMVLKAIRIIQPDYQPRVDPTKSQCSSPLVQDYYTQVFLVGFNMIRDTLDARNTVEKLQEN